MRLRRTIVCLFLLGLSLHLFSQEDEKRKLFGDVITVRGYVKEMQTASFTNLDTVLIDNLIHNRFDIKSYLGEKWTTAISVRNRIIYGDQVFFTPGYGDLLEIDNGIVDLNWSWLNKRSTIGHTMIDRAYVNYTAEKWEARIGRQRINWGIALSWNPNDVFNAYNFIDFDYEERPGADAIRFQYYLPDGMSQLDAAVSVNSNNEVVAAGMYKFNKWSYDFQILAGMYYDDVTMGIGWAGNIKNAGFKGEASYFQDASNLDTSGVLSFVLQSDYSFKNSSYVNAAVLINSGGTNQAIDLVNNPNVLASFGNITAKSLFPTKYTLMATYSYPLSELWSVNASLLYGAGMNLGFISPTVTYSAKQNLDFTLVGQLFGAEVNEEYQTLGNSVFFRIKYSF